MPHTNSTTNYSLPQFLSTDKPAWLTDVNPAYVAIDTGMHNAQTAADDAQGDATQALSDASDALTAAATADAKAAGAIASISEAFDSTTTYNTGDYVTYNNLLYVCIADVTTPGDWTGSTNWNRASVDSIATALKTDMSNIKIQDLSNVTLTTSDNDKILGVSVSGDTISVSAVDYSAPDVQTITAINGVTIRLVRIGNQAYLIMPDTGSQHQFPASWSYVSDDAVDANKRFRGMALNCITPSGVVVNFTIDSNTWRLRWSASSTNNTYVGNTIAYPPYDLRP